MNTTITLRLPKTKFIKNEIKYVYTDEEINKILKRFENDDAFTCSFLVACYTGMRTGEVYALTWDDIDFGNTIEQRIVANKDDVVYHKNINFVFTKYDGTYVGTDITKYPFKVIHDELGINARFYDLRGSYATKILNNGIEIKDVADILGHGNIETTENYYISSTSDGRKNANVVFDKIMQSDVIDEISAYSWG